MKMFSLSCYWAYLGKIFKDLFISSFSTCQSTMILLSCLLCALAAAVSSAS